MLTREKFPEMTLDPTMLAPGDGKSAALDPAAFTWTRIRNTGDPAFERAYGLLWAEFGAKNEMETRAVLDARFRLGAGMNYEMLLVEHGNSVAAVRDHTAIWASSAVIVHLSHVFVAQDHRRSGLAGWLRAAPIATARETAATHGTPAAPVTLVGEMEYDDGSDPMRAIRLAAYERAGYLKVDPARVRYHQPDFRTPAEIDASGGPQPVPFQLILRRVGRERETTIRGAELRAIVSALYAMYGAQFRPQDMSHPALNLATLPPDDAEIALVPPTAK